MPRAFAFALVLLAAGLIAREKPLLAGLAGGIAAVYDPAIAAPFWIVVLLAVAFDARSRHLLRPALPILLIFVLLLGNLAQLQPEIVERQNLFSRISDPFALLQQYRTPFVWVSLWASDMWHYLAIFVCGLWAIARIWPVLNRQIRWFFLGLPVCGLLGVLFSYLLLDRLRWSLISQIQPARALLYTVVFASLACGVAGVRACRARKMLEASLWFILIFALPMNARVLDLAGFRNSTDIRQLALAIVLACVLALLIAQFGSTRWKPVLLLMPVAAIFTMPVIGGVTEKPELYRESIQQVANWAENETWGSSMFLFPDAGRALYPGTFRAESLRALWVDWNSGSLVPYFESFAAEWWQRWQDTMQDGFSPQRLENMLPLPVDYYVLKRGNQLRGIKPVFQNRDFVVYDAGDLRSARKPLVLARAEDAR